MEDPPGLAQQTARQQAAVPQQRQAEPAVALTLGPEEAFSRMQGDQAAELSAYVFGVQAVIWGMQWVKGGQALRIASAPLPSGAWRSALDPRAHGVNVWGHARALLTDKMRLIETPNTETLYSTAVVDLVDGPVVVVHPIWASATSAPQSGSCTVTRTPSARSRTEAIPRRTRCSRSTGTATCRRA